MKKGLYEDFRRAEKLGETYVRDLFCVVFNEAKKDKDLAKIDELFDVAKERKSWVSKEMQKVYDDLLPSFMRD